MRKQCPLRKKQKNQIVQKKNEEGLDPLSFENLRKKACYIGLMPWDFKRMTIDEFLMYYEQQMEHEMDKMKTHELFAARICAVIANVNRDKKKKSTPFKEKDFMSKEQKKKKPMSTKQMVAVCEALTLAFGGEITYKKGGEK